jgi:hypothetical protein
MRRNLFSRLLGLAFGLAMGVSSGNADVIESINATADPDLAASWNVPDVGWVYVPTASFTFSGIGTKFGSSDGRTVNAEIFSGTPGNLLLLGAGGLVPEAGRFCLHDLFPERRPNRGADVFSRLPERTRASCELCILRARSHELRRRLL